MGNDENPNGTPVLRCIVSLVRISSHREIATRYPWISTQRRQLHHMESPGQAGRLHKVNHLTPFPPCTPQLTGTFLASYPDRVRGVLNEGGLFGERQGWHLPGFDTFKWETRALSQGIPNGAGIGFFVTTLELDVPRDADAMMSFVFDNGGTQDQDYRALLFVNGWQFGKVRRTLERAMLLSLRSPDLHSTCREWQTSGHSPSSPFRRVSSIITARSKSFTYRIG